MDGEVKDYPFCKGSGKSHKCEGTEQRLIRRRGLRLSRPVACNACQGSGECELCYGTGKKQPEV